MTDIEQLKKLLADAGNVQDPLDRRMAVLAVVTEALAAAGVRPVVVGGLAVELYTAGGYSTSDIDMVTPYTSKVNPIMESLGFVREGRHWLHAEIDVFIEMPEPPLAGSADKIVAMSVQGLPVYVIGVEDLIMDRLRAFEHWKSKDDGRWATQLIAFQSDRIDWAYLRKQVTEEGLDDAFERMKQEAEVE